MHENIIYRVADVSWGIKSTLGNHRFIVEAPEGEYVRVTLPWRRRDKNYAELGIRIRYGERADGVGSIEIRDIIIESATKEECTVVFRAPVSGEYELYYMPYIMPDTWYSPQTDYFYATAMTPDTEWVAAFDESKVKLASATAYEARTEFDSFYPMEVVMTKAELDALKAELTDCIDGKTTTYYGAKPSDPAVNDIWYDTANGKIFRYTNSGWVDITNQALKAALDAASDAQSTADGKIVTFAQSTQPTATAIGDLWINTSEGNKLYRWSGTKWVVMQSPPILAPNSTILGPFAVYMISTCAGPF